MVTSAKVTSSSSHRWPRFARGRREQIETDALEFDTGAAPLVDNAFGEERVARDKAFDQRFDVGAGRCGADTFLHVRLERRTTHGEPRQNLGLDRGREAGQPRYAGARPVGARRLTVEIEHQPFPYLDHVEKL